jgi:hypothetical protein
MRRNHFIFALVLFISACAAPIKHAETSPSISLSDVENVLLNQDSATNLKHLFGDPSKILSFSPSDDVWIYNGYRYGIWSERATFRVDKKSGTILSAVWLPDESDAFSRVPSVLAHFKNSKFKIQKPVPAGNGHYYTSDVNYVSLENGISFAVNDHTQSVTGIAIGSANKARTPATK